jgi:hypothetical protein
LRRDLPLRVVFNLTCGPDVDCRQALHCAVVHAVLRQETKRTRVISVEAAEVSQYRGESDQQSEPGHALARAMQEQGVLRHEVCTWLRH